MGGLVIKVGIECDNTEIRVYRDGDNSFNKLSESE